MLILSPCFGFVGDEILEASARGLFRSRRCWLGRSVNGAVYEELRCYGLYEGSVLCAGYLTHQFCYEVGDGRWDNYRWQMYRYVADVEVWFGEFASDDDAYGCQDISVDCEYDEYGKVVATYVDPPVDLSSGWYISATPGWVAGLAVVSGYDPLRCYENRYVRVSYVGACVGADGIWLTMAAHNYGTFTLSKLSDPEYVHQCGSAVMRLVSGFAALV